MNNKKKHSGYSLVELMVAMLIGLFLLGSIFAIYTGNKKSYNTQQQYLRLEDSGRNALYELTNTIQHAGYRTANMLPIGSYFITTAPTPATCNGTGVANAAGSATHTNIANASTIKTVTDGATTNSDTIGIVYMGDAKINEDCTGAALPTNCSFSTTANFNTAKIYSSFDIATDANGIPLLRCTGSLQAATVTLVKGVEKMQINYGVDKDMDGQVDNYMNASMVSSESAWNRVISVQVAVLVRTLKKVRDTAEAQSYVLLDKKFDFTADRYQRAVFTTLIRLPNSHL